MGSHISSKKHISLKLEKLTRETRSQWQAILCEGGVTALFAVWSDSQRISSLQSWMGAPQLKLNQPN